MGRYQEALAAIEEAVRSLGKEDDIQNVIFDFHRGIILLCMGQEKDGMELVERVRVTVGDEILGPYVSMNLMADYYRRAGSPEKALRVVTNQLKKYRENGMSYLATLSLVNIGAYKLRQSDGKGDEGEAELNEAYAIAQSAGYGYLITQIHFYRAGKALETGDRGQALKEISACLESASRYEQNNFIIQEGRISPKLLIFAFENDVEREYLMKHLPKIGQDVIPMLGSVLKSGSPQVRKSAIMVLGEIGSVKAAPYIRKGLRDPDQLVRRAANDELASMRNRIDDPDEIITPRESQVLALLTTGLSNAEIADRLFISEPTVKTHVTRIFRKLGLTRRSQAAVYFQKKPEEREKS